MALSYLDAEYDEIMLNLRLNLPIAFEAMNCFLSGMRQEIGAKHMQLSKRQYKDQLKYARLYLKKEFAKREITPSLVLDGRVLSQSLWNKLHFMFPERN